MKSLFGLLHPPHVLRAADKQQPGEDLLYEGAGLRKREPRSFAGPHPFGLEKRIGDGTDHHVVLPGVTEALEARDRKQIASQVARLAAALDRAAAILDGAR